MFTNEEIKNKSTEWSLNEDVCVSFKISLIVHTLIFIYLAFLFKKLLEKLKSLDELLSTKSKEVLDNVNNVDNKIENEAILIKNLINDFYLVGHKQFVENRVEEENEVRLFKSTENEDSFKRDEELDQNSLIHSQMKKALDNSLKFVKAKLIDLKQDATELGESNQKLNQDKRIEKLIKLNRYHQRNCHQ